MSMNTKLFVARFKVKASVDYADSNPNMADSNNMNHYKVTLRMNGRQMTVPFSQGYGIKHEPTAADVLDCLASDAAGFQNTRSFEEWAAEYGYDTDSRKAESTFRNVKRQTEKLMNLIGDHFDRLVWDTERL